MKNKTISALMMAGIFTLALSASSEPKAQVIAHKNNVVLQKSLSDDQPRLTEGTSDAIIPLIGLAIAAGMKVALGGKAAAEVVSGVKAVKEAKGNIEGAHKLYDDYKAWREAAPEPTCEEFVQKNSARFGGLETAATPGCQRTLKDWGMFLAEFEIEAKKECAERQEGLCECEAQIKEEVKYISRCITQRELFERRNNKVDWCSYWNDSTPGQLAPQFKWPWEK